MDNKYVFCVNMNSWAVSMNRVNNLISSCVQKGTRVGYHKGMKWYFTVVSFFVQCFFLWTDIYNCGME